MDLLTLFTRYSCILPLLSRSPFVILLSPTRWFSILDSENLVVCTVQASYCPSTPSPISRQYIWKCRLRFHLLSTLSPVKNKDKEEVPRFLCSSPSKIRSKPVDRVCMGAYINSKRFKLHFESGCTPSWHQRGGDGHSWFVLVSVGLGKWERVTQWGEKEWLMKPIFHKIAFSSLQKRRQVSSEMAWAWQAMDSSHQTNLRLHLTFKDDRCYDIRANCFSVMSSSFKRKGRQEGKKVMR